MSTHSIDLQSASIVDVRTVEEFNSGHVPGSVNIPMDQIPQRLDELKALKKPLVLCCASGNRSGHTARYLVGLGFEEVYNGGGWEDVLYAMNT